MLMMLTIVRARDVIVTVVHLHGRTSMVMQVFLRRRSPAHTTASLRNSQDSFMITFTAAAVAEPMVFVAGAGDCVNN